MALTHPSRFTARLATLALSLALLAACRPGGDGGPAPAGAGASAAPALEVAVTVTDAVVGSGTVEVRVTEGGAPVAGASVTVQGDMTHAGMVPVIAEAPEAEAGVYRTGSFAFSMAGDWIVTAEVETADGRSAEAETFLTVAR